MAYLFSQEFSACEETRNQAICDILFLPNPPSIQPIIESVPKPLSKNVTTWTDDYKRWDTWIVGTLNKAVEFRNSEYIAGLGGTGSSQRIMIENQLYYQVKKQTEQLNEQNIQIQKLNAKIDILMKQSKSADEWDDLIDETVSMI